MKTNTVSASGPGGQPSEFQEIIPSREALNLGGTVALVTGGNQGIGRAICGRLARDGFQVIAADLQLSPSPPSRDEAVMLESGVTGRLLDVTKPAEVAELVTWIENDLGPITVLVNNAGIMTVSSLLQLTEKDLREVFEVNFFGTFFCTQAVAPRMVKRRCGRIVNIASIAGKGGRPKFASYAASKAAVLNLTQSYALTLAPYTITVNAVCPGIVRTSLWEQLDRALSALEGVAQGEALRRRVSQIPLQRLESVDDVANFVSYLVSPQGAYITGQGINVDGGLEFH